MVVIVWWLDGFTASYAVALFMSASSDERKLFVLLIFVELLTITV